jgi:uncharacterized protein YecE (DUF72 family)
MPRGRAGAGRREGGICRVGTSGWTYDSWRGPLYPQTLPKSQWLKFYGAQFTTTEINASFYRTPSLDAVRSWRQQTPADFTFAWKASKFITHWKRLKANSASSIALMQTRLRPLESKLGIVLFQLPANFGKDRARLNSFLDLLPKRYRYAFEFRNTAWYADDIIDLLRDRNIALCISDHADAPAPWIATAHHVYIRAHGPSGRYRGSYPDATLKNWAGNISAWRKEDHDVYIYFDNDQKAAAPKDARRLLDLLSVQDTPQAKKKARSGS